ncbi:hypothetical protein A3Q56_05079 [Intoshia linei]|uniref:DNA-directed RNA polymerase III subunit RPC9 n=1 Tax=Intoshia linei TaxID=1819745 RepID=A0A177AYY7_9BILA|nr:hypothetical protein A3Q56_05079 [Intoshia linei]
MNIFNNEVIKKDKGLTPYEISKIIAKVCKPHTFGETVILPAISVAISTLMNKNNIIQHINNNKNPIEFTSQIPLNTLIIDTIIVVVSYNSWYTFKMKLIGQSKLFSNNEMFELLKSYDTNKDYFLKPEKKHIFVSEIFYESYKYLQGRYPSLTDVSDATTEKNKIIDKLSNFKLTKGEVYQILNLQPQSFIEIQLVLDECDERFTEQEVDSILLIFKRD